MSDCFVTGHSKEMRKILEALGLQDLGGILSLKITANPGELVTIHLTQAMNEEQVANLHQLIQDRRYVLMRLLDDEVDSDANLNLTTAEG